MGVLKDESVMRSQPRKVVMGTRVEKVTDHVGRNTETLDQFAQ